MSDLYREPTEHEMKLDALGVLSSSVQLRPVIPVVPDTQLTALSIWIDEHNAHKSVNLQMWERIGKIGEEFGECIGALIGYLGQNPRKGHTHSLQDIRKELLDIAVTALAAHEHVTGNTGITEQAFSKHLFKVIQRAGLETTE